MSENHIKLGGSGIICQIDESFLGINLSIIAGEQHKMKYELLEWFIFSTNQRDGL